MKKVLITGSAGLIGSEAAKFFAAHDFIVYGVDNNMRKYFFGDEASTDWSRNKLQVMLKDRYKHYTIDIREQNPLEALFQKNIFDLIIHTAAQPSHDWAAREPLTDFSINALGTLYLLENFRKYAANGVFIFTSTNKVYGDRPNTLPYIETETRYELPNEHRFYQGVDETMSIDQSTHSIFGASKVSADIMVQEYGRYFKMKTVSFRGGCLTGPAHSGAKLHGFLAYLIRCIANEETYSIFGYQGKQVRDNIHSFDLVNAFYQFYQHPRSGEVYNIGGSRLSNVSMIEAIKKTEKILHKKAKIVYTSTPRIGDHKWYISDITKFRKHFTSWKMEYDIDNIIDEICRIGHIA